MIPCSKYVFRARAWNAFGTSDWGNVSSTLMTLAAPVTLLFILTLKHVFVILMHINFIGNCKYR